MMTHFKLNSKVRMRGNEGCFLLETIDKEF